MNRTIFPSQHPLFGPVPVIQRIPLLIPERIETSLPGGMSFKGKRISRPVKVVGLNRLDSSASIRGMFSEYPLSVKFGSIPNGAQHALQLGTAVCYYSRSETFIVKNTHSPHATQSRF